MKKVYSIINPVKIKNAVGTSDRECECDSWLDHWEIFSGDIADTCAVAGCDNEAEMGAHITRPNASHDGYRTHLYIIPMCYSHNGKRGKELTSKGNIKFVWANVSNTCGE